MSTDLQTGCTISEAAHRLSISENAVRQRIKRGSLPAIKAGSVWRVQLADHEATIGSTGRDYQADHSTAPPSDQTAWSIS